MADFKLKRRSDTPVTVADTGLNSLANNAAVLSAAITQDSDMDLEAIFELFVNTFGTAPTDFAPIELWLVRQIDGTNYEDGSATGPIYPRNGYGDSFFVRNTNSVAQRILTQWIRLPPRDFKALLVNKSGQAFPSSGNTLKMLAVRETSV